MELRQEMPLVRGGQLRTDESVYWDAVIGCSCLMLIVAIILGCAIGPWLFGGR